METTAKMIGTKCPYGPGGRDCVCCAVAPKGRKAMRRYAKRSERNAWKAEVAA